MKTSLPSINELWCRVKAHAGKEFKTKTGKMFTYTISGDLLHTSRTDYNISKTEFHKAFALVPFEGPSVINRDVRGPAYVWAVLHDKRIRKQDW